MLFAGLCAVRKGVHFALEAWLRSPASTDGTFLIAGDFLPAYREKLAPLLAHPSVQVLGHRDDVAELMRVSDVLVLPSIEEGSALAANEAIASGCVPLVSDRASGVMHARRELARPRSNRHRPARAADHGGLRGRRNCSRVYVPAAARPRRASLGGRPALGCSRSTAALPRKSARRRRIQASR